MRLYEAFDGYWESPRIKLEDSESFPDLIEGPYEIMWVKQGTNVAVDYIPYWRGYEIDELHSFRTIGNLKRYIRDYILEDVWYRKLKDKPEKELPNNASIENKIHYLEI
jgi:hypothetical protein